MKPLKPAFKKWADLVLGGMPPIDACLKVFPHITKKTAANKTVLFGKNNDIQSYIKERSQKISDKVDNLVAEELKTNEVGRILSATEKRDILSKIILGQLEVEKIVIVKGVPKKIVCKPDASDIMKAIDIDNKMSGDNVQAKPNQVAKAQEVDKVVVVEDSTPTYGKTDSNK